MEYEENWIHNIARCCRHETAAAVTKAVYIHPLGASLASVARLNQCSHWPRSAALAAANIMVFKAAPLVPGERWTHHRRDPFLTVRTRTWNNKYINPQKKSNNNLGSGFLAATAAFSILMTRCKAQRQQPLLCGTKTLQQRGSHIAPRHRSPCDSLPWTAATRSQHRKPVVFCTLSGLQRVFVVSPPRVLCCNDIAIYMYIAWPSLCHDHSLLHPHLDAQRWECQPIFGRTKCPSML